MTGNRKFCRAPNPAAVIEGQSAGRDQTVQMKMVIEDLIPGMEDGDDSHRSAQAPLAKLQERFTDGFKQKS